MRALFGELKALTAIDPASTPPPRSASKPRSSSCRRSPEHGRLPVVTFTAGGIAAADAALCMQLGADGVFVGSGIFKSAAPCRRANAIVAATIHFRDPEVLARVSGGLGASMAGMRRHEAAHRQPERVAERASLRDAAHR